MEKFNLTNWTFNVAAMYRFLQKIQQYMYKNYAIYSFVINMQSGFL